MEYYVVRNERIPQLAIYSFKDGERFEPDFLLFIKKATADKYDNKQIYIEPKGNNLLEEDKWKETFLLEMNEMATVDHRYDYGNNYKIIGLPFFNQEYKKAEFEEYVNKILENL